MSKLAKDYLTCNIPRTLFTNSIPMIIGIGFAISFSMVDMYFVGQLGTLELAAMTIIFPIAFVVFGVAMGVGTGSSAVISKAIGEGNHQKVKELTTDSLFLGLLLVGLFVTIGFLFFEEIFILYGATPEQLPLVKEYMFVWYLGVMFLVIPVIGNSAIRAKGDTTTPSKIMLGAVLVNLIFDPLLIFGYGPFPRLEMEGAAIATVGGRATAFIWATYVLTKKYDMLDLGNISLKRFIDSSKQILHVGVFSIITNVLTPIGFAVIISFIASYGNEAVGAYGAGSRIETIVLSVFMALSAVLGPFIGQNWGANNWQRIRSVLNYSYLYTIVFSLFSMLIFYFFSDYIAETFAARLLGDKMVGEERKVIEYLSVYLNIIMLSFVFRGIIFMATTTFNVLKKPIVSMNIILGYVFILFVPLAWLLEKEMGMEGIFYALVFSSIIVGAISYFYLNKVLTKLENE